MGVFLRLLQFLQFGTQGGLFRLTLFGFCLEIGDLLGQFFVSDFRFLGLF